MPSPRLLVRRGYIRCAGCVAIVIAIQALVIQPSFANDSPSPFYYGADSNGPSGTGSGYPFMEPGTGGIYGAYLGELSTYTDYLGCTSGSALNAGDISQVNQDEPWPGWGITIPGVMWYYYLGGPGADPNYNGTTSEAFAWGQSQGYAAAVALEQVDQAGNGSDTTYDQLIFADVEPDPSWQYVLTGACSATISGTLPPGLAYQTYEGFLQYILDLYLNDGWPVLEGTYSAPAWFNPIIGSSVDPAWSWTYESSNGVVTPDPVGFTQSGYGSAQWFGAYSSAEEVAWQWDQSGGDYDQWDTGNVP